MGTAHARGRPDIAVLARNLAVTTKTVRSDLTAPERSAMPGACMVVGDWARAQTAGVFADVAVMGTK